MQQETLLIVSTKAIYVGRNRNATNSDQCLLLKEQKRMNRIQDV